MRTIDRHLIGGQLVPSHGRDRIEIRSPYDGALLGDAILGDDVDAEQAIAAAKAAFPRWSATTLNERRAVLDRIASAIEDRAPELRAAMISEFGALAAFADAGVAMSSAFFRLAASYLEEGTFTKVVDGAEVTNVPLGVVALLTPWNGDPMFIAGKAAWAIAAGCTVVVKPSELSVLQTQVLIDSFLAADVPHGVINVVNGRGSPVGDTLIGSPDIRKISFTGSTTVGKMIYREASDTMKRLTLELGGKSPTIIMDDADMGEAARFALRVGLYNSGQGCIAGTRIFVPEARIGEAEIALREAAAGLAIGDPAEPATVIQPMITAAHWQRVQDFIETGMDEGATVLIGGPGKPEGLEAGHFVRPTIFSGVTPGMTIAREEIFGPVLCLMSYVDDDDAIGQANDTQFGLFAYVFGQDLERARAIANRLEAGSVVINEMRMSLSAPFGGFKDSGLGRENGLDGLLSFTEPRTLYAPAARAAA